MIWCGVTAILLLSLTPENLKSDPLGYIIFAVCNGGAISVAIVLLSSIAKKAQCEPGYWLAVASLIDGFARTREIVYVGFYGFGETPKLLFMMAFTLLAIVQCDWNWYWKASIGLIGGQMILTNFPITLTQLLPFSAFDGQGWRNSLFRSVANGTESLAVVFTLLAIGMNLYRKHKRDWLHWGGLLYCMMLWVYMIQEMFFE